MCAVYTGKQIAMRSLNHRLSLLANLKVILVFKTFCVC